LRQRDALHETSLTVRSPALRRLVRKIATTFASVLLPGLALTAASATVFMLPAPTGPYPVTTASFTMSREAQRDVPRGEYAVQLWYPSKPAPSRASYDLGERGWKDALYRHLIQSHAGVGAPAIEGPESFPLVVYVAGWGGRGNENTVLAEELASRGYLVAAISDVVRDTPPLASIGAPLDLSSDAAFRYTTRLAPEKAAYLAQRASHVLDHLLAPNALAAYGLAGRVDHRRVGIVGYSFGGAVARLAAQRDRRFRASVNLDGWLFSLDRIWSDRGVPYLYISTLEDAPTAEDLAASDPVRRHTAQLDRDDLRSQMHELMHAGIWIEIAGTAHESFSDVPLFSISRRLKHRSNAVHTARVVESYINAFLDETLKGQSSPRLASKLGQDPSVTLRRWVDGHPFPFPPDAMRNEQ
jgi:dienelactone hydrolase